jgi:hypothetical protein
MWKKPVPSNAEGEDENEICFYRQMCLLLFEIMPNGLHKYMYTKHV